MIQKKKLAHFVMLILFFMGCKKEFDTPPLKPVNAGATLSVATLKSRTNGSNSFFKFSGGDTNLFCTVTMDESSGNIYKQVFVRDDEGSALQLRLVSSGGLFAGDRIRINLNNLYIVAANNMIYLDSVDLEKNVVKISSGNLLLPKVTTISKILSMSSQPKSSESMQSHLVELNSVEFSFYARGQPFANAVGKTAIEYPLTDCSGFELMVRTSGMSNFAPKLTPSGNGKIIAVVQQYNSELSLVIRNFNEVQMNNTACKTTPPTTITGTAYLQKDFNDNNLTSGGWVSSAVTGTTSWSTSNIGESSYYGKAYNKNGSQYEACETWLISPAINLYNSTSPVLSFQTANSSTVSGLSLMVSTDYLNGLPSTATWTSIPFSFPSGGFNFQSSGTIALNNYKSQNFRMAFKYTGTSTSGSIWEVDDIAVYEK